MPKPWEKKARQDHRDPMRTLACADCGQVSKEMSAWESGAHGNEQSTRRPCGRCRLDAGGGRRGGGWSFGGWSP